MNLIKGSPIRINLNHSRMLATRVFAAPLLLVSAGSALAAVRYVDVNSVSYTTTYMDTNAVGTGPFFYRVGVSAP